MTPSTLRLPAAPKKKIALLAASLLLMPAACGPGGEGADGVVAGEPWLS